MRHERSQRIRKPNKQEREQRAQQQREQPELPVEPPPSCDVMFQGTRCSKPAGHTGDHVFMQDFLDAPVEQGEPPAAPRTVEDEQLGERYPMEGELPHAHDDEPNELPAGPANDDDVPY